MLEQTQDGSYPDGGDSRLISPALTRRPAPAEVFKILEADYHVPHQLVEVLCESVTRSVAQVVDDAVDQRKRPLAYFVVRRLDGDGWWNR
jgi:hypothetical protein